MASAAASTSPMSKPARLDRITKLRKKAESTFPPAFVNAPQEGNVATKEGDYALSKGRWANQRRKPAPRDSGRTGKVPPGVPLSHVLI